MLIWTRTSSEQIKNWGEKRVGHVATWGKYSRQREEPMQSPWGKRVWGVFEEQQWELSSQSRVSDGRSTGEEAGRIQSKERTRSLCLMRTGQHCKSGREDFIYSLKVYAPLQEHRGSQFSSASKLLPIYLWLQTSPMKLWLMAAGGKNVPSRACKWDRIHALLKEQIHSWKGMCVKQGELNVTPSHINRTRSSLRTGLWDTSVSATADNIVPRTI